MALIIWVLRIGRKKKKMKKMMRKIRRTWTKLMSMRPKKKVIRPKRNIRNILMNQVILQKKRDRRRIKLQDHLLQSRLIIHKYITKLIMKVMKLSKS